MTRWLFRLLLVAAVLLAGWGGYLALFPQSDSFAVCVIDPDRDFGERQVGAAPLTFRIANNSDRPVRIVGLTEG